MNRAALFSILTIAFLSPHALSFSQEYNYETGAAAGTSFYMGDANKTKLFLHPGIAAGGIYRYNINFHWAVKGNLVAGTLSGDTRDAQNVFPNEGQTTFKRTFAELGGQMEYNFFPYSDKYGYLGTKPYTPYLFAGLGTTVANGDNLFLNANVPVGIGFKYKLKNRVNIGFEFSMRKLFGDNLDVTENEPALSLDAPYGIESSKLKNQDWYSLTLVFVTWEFGLKKDPCHGM